MAPDCNEPQSKPTGTYSYDPSSLAFGSLMVLITCCSSSFAGVFSEKLLKGGGGDDSMHVANIKLYTFGLLVNGSLALAKQIAFHPDDPVGLFSGFNNYAIVTAFGSAMTGLMTAVVLRYFDMIVKSISVSVAMLTIYTSSIFILGKPVTLQFTLAVCTISIAIYVYNVIARDMKELQTSLDTYRSTKTIEDGTASMPMTSEEERLMAPNSP